MQNVVDRLEIGGVVPPPNWSENMAKILTPNPETGKQRGQLQVSGTQIAIRARVANEALRQQVVSNLATGSIRPTRSTMAWLPLAAGRKACSTRRFVEPRCGSSRADRRTLTASGAPSSTKWLLPSSRSVPPKVQLIGHTDSQGNHQANVALSLARASTVRNYLIDKGIPVESLSASGAGRINRSPSNDTAEAGLKPSYRVSAGWAIELRWLRSQRPCPAYQPPSASTPSSSSMQQGAVVLTTVRNHS